LTDGQLYVLAGGNGRRAGSGYTVGGRRSVLRRAGWLEMVGGYGAERSDPKQRSQAARRFLDDLEIVVEEYYGGVVAGYDQGQWISLDAIRELGVQEIMNLNVRPFLPADYRERRRQTIRERGIEVHDTPEELHRAISRQVTVSAERIRFARRDRRLSQQALADLLGVHQTMISQIETGKRPVPEELRDAIERWLAGG
jgi:DNA-binding transcriptional regulator YiaG